MDAVAPINVRVPTTIYESKDVKIANGIESIRHSKDAVEVEVTDECGR